MTWTELCEFIARGGRFVSRTGRDERGVYVEIAPEESGAVSAR